VLLPVAASAQTVDQVICALATSLTGMTAKAMGSVAIIAIGVAALFNKASWGLAMTVCVGIALMFGASSVLNALGLSGQFCTQNTLNTNFTCGNNTTTTPTNFFYFADTLTGQTNGQTGSTQILQGTGTVEAANFNNQGILYSTLAIFKATVGDAMARMYCGMLNGLKPSITAMLSFLVVIFGAGIATGIVNFTAKEAMILAFKIALVCAFALDPSWGIGIGYRFFISFSETLSNVVLSVMGAGVTMDKPDKVVLGLMNLTSGGQPPPSAMDSLHALITPGSSTYVPPMCWGILAPLLLALVIFMPFIIVFVILLILQYLGLFFRILLGYLSSLLMISLLFVFAPLFICFSLFKLTKGLFESWIKYLISFSLQMIIMFAMLAFISLMPSANFFTNLMGLLKEQNNTFSFLLFTTPIHFCGICDFMLDPAGSNNLVCVPHPGTTAQQAAAAGFILSADGNYWVMSLLNLITHMELARYVVIQSISVYLLGVFIEDFMKHAPALSRALGNLPAAVGLVGGGAKYSQGTLDYPGSAVFESAYLGLKSGLNTRYSLNPITDWRRRITAATIGTRQEIRDKNNKVVGYSDKRSGGLFNAILYGAWDETNKDNIYQKTQIQKLKNITNQYKEEATQENAKLRATLNDQSIARQELESINARLGTEKDAGIRSDLIGQREAAIEKFEKAIADHDKAVLSAESAKKKLDRYQKRLDLAVVEARNRERTPGLLQVRDKDGRVIQRSALEQQRNDETSKQLQQYRENAQDMAKQGKLDTQDKENYYLLKLPRAAQGGGEEINIDRMRNDIFYKIDELDKQLAAAERSGLDAKESDKLRQQINSAKDRAEYAKTEQRMEQIKGDIVNIANKVKPQKEKK